MVTTNEPPVLSLMRRLLDPVVILGSLMLSVGVYDDHFNGLYLILGVVAFLISAQVFDEFDLIGSANLRQARVLSHSRNLLVAWSIVVGVLMFLGYASGLGSAFPEDVMTTWVVMTPVLLFFAHMAARAQLRHLYRKGKTRRAVLVGVGELGQRLARHIQEAPHLMITLEGCFDDRSRDRLSLPAGKTCLGKMADVAEYVKQNSIDLVYVALPLVNQPRIVNMIEALRDSTASLYFVPDVFIFDLVQARIDDVNGMPVIAIFESPLTGINAVQKRLFDIVVGSLILALISPLLLVIALAVKLTSPGPIIFKQRRYGMDGEQILVYKFRSMTVCEDGAHVAQATKNDQRVTPLGAFLRRTSLDELPQFINVLQGRMSIVGPRPHAIAHNEMYRKLITGYMWRHKVKPGITGWAQVNGYRGETDSLDKMEGRVLYDIDYLKNWSLGLDFAIILRTIKLVLKDSQAY